MVTDPDINAITLVGTDIVYESQGTKTWIRWLMISLLFSLQKSENVHHLVENYQKTSLLGQIIQMGF